MSLPTKYTPIALHVWSRENEDELRAEFANDQTIHKDLRCHECDGRGEIECDYGHSHECEECGGDGVMNGDYAFSRYVYDAYHRQVDHDRARFNSFQEESCHSQN